MTATTALGPLVKSVRVAASPARAFELFTARIGAWWPLETHSVGGSSSWLALEPRLGGRLVESLADGGTAEWGEVTRWEPPTRVAFTWHPGTPPEEATRVEVSFAPDGSGTLVTLVHSGWESRRQDGATAREGYDTGWEIVLRPYADLAGE
jgi:uncharacterized protein YndB with AHSA1/START domain